MKKRNNKIIAPVVVTIIMIIYYVLYFGLLIQAVDGIWRIFLGILPPIFTALTVKVCIERINEIKKGEEDDISKY